jgi:hypothetical protein
MAFKLTTKTVVPILKTGAKVAVPAGAGFLFGRMGSAVAQHASPSLQRFAAKGPYHEGFVRLLIGVPLGLVLAFLLAKKNPKTFVKLAALSVAGTVATAAEPALRTTLVKAETKLKAMLSKGTTAPAQLPASTATPAAGFLGEGARAGGTYLETLSASRRGRATT